MPLLEVPLLMTKWLIKMTWIIIIIKKNLIIQGRDWKNLVHLPTLTVLTVLGIISHYWSVACLISEWSTVGLVKYSVWYTRGLWHQPDLCKTLYSPRFIHSLSLHKAKCKTAGFVLKANKDRALPWLKVLKVLDFFMLTLKWPLLFHHLKETHTGKWAWNVKCSENQMDNVK